MPQTSDGTSGGHDLVFDNLDFSGSSILFTSSAGGPGTYDITLQNSILHDTAAAAISVTNTHDHDWTISNDTLHHTGDSAMIIWGSNITVSHSTITDTGWNPAITWGKHGIYDKGPNTTIANNDFASNAGGQAISLRFHGAHVYGNTIHNTPYGIAFFDYDTPPAPTNVGSSYSESAGYGEHLVQLTPDLTVRAASHPADLVKPLDLDLTGSPVILTRKGCGELVVATSKVDTVYGWRAGNIAAGPIWELQLETFNAGNPLVSQLAWSPLRSSLYAVTGSHFVRITIGADCKATAAWKIPLGTITENGSPTVAGNTVWFAVNKTAATTLNGYNATTGKLEEQLPLGGLTLTAPTIVNGELLIGTFTGLVQGFAAAGVLAGSAESPPAQPGTATQVSKLDSKHAWESRSDGVYATDDGGKAWRKIYPEPANTVVRPSTTAGVIDVPTSPGRCMCATRKLWTTDSGRSWHQTTLVGDDFTGTGKNVYWWAGGTLHALVNFPGIRTRSHGALKVANGTIVDAVTVPGGVVALVSNRVNGLGWDTSPRVAVIRGGRTQTVTLPAQTGDILVQALVVHWPRLTVTGTDFESVPVKAVRWVSANGCATWSTG